MNSNETIRYKYTAFDSEQYFHLQRDKILERIGKFAGGRLYLEIGGKFLYDPHASRVLPGFDPYVKKAVFESLKDRSDVIFCTNATDIENNRQLKNSAENYRDVVLERLNEFKITLGIVPKVAINLVTDKENPKLLEFKNILEKLGYRTYLGFHIQGYPKDTSKVLSNSGYGLDEYIELEKDLILVVGPASNSGKLSTCLGQVYLDETYKIKSGYAKFETFPIWNLQVSHPVNLAYEAATADIGDFNIVDQYHFNAYGQHAVNYNRDLEAFEIVKMLSDRFVSNTSHMRKYKSPTDMGVNYAGFAITNDEIVSVASLNEIRRRIGWYQESVDRNEGKITWINKCKELEKSALKYITNKGYNPDLDLVK